MINSEIKNGLKTSYYTFERGVLRDEYYYDLDGVENRGNKPAHISYHKPLGNEIIGRVKSKTFNIGGKQGRINDKPTHVEYYENGNIHYFNYLDGETEHRPDNKPSYMQFTENGIITHKFYKVNGQSHRDGDFPSFEYFLNDGTLSIQHYSKDGFRHRDGLKPAHIEYNRDGSVKRAVYYKNGVEITNQALIAIKRKQILDKI